MALQIEKIVEHISRLYEYNQAEIVGKITEMRSESYVSMKEDNPTKKYFSISPVKN